MVANMNWTSPKSEDGGREKSFITSSSTASHPMDSSIRSVRSDQSYPSNLSSSATEGNWPWGELIGQSNSHPFTKRVLLLNQPVKIGRAVAHLKASPDNAIFDCKVLSRHHACLWYEDGHFYLKDTKSSNGTFVNNNRLSSGKDSKPYEVFSGDTVQFGVDIVENVSDIVHACIIATLKLYSADCVRARGSSGAVDSCYRLDDLYVINKYLQEALQREHILTGKLNDLSKIVETCREAALNSWHALVSEERLLSRIQFLERSLAACSSTSEEQNKLCQEIDSKYQYQLNATEALRAAHEKHVSLLKKVESLQLVISSSENECSVLKNQSDIAFKELQELCTKCMTTEELLQKAQTALTDTEKQLEEERKKVAGLIAKENKPSELENYKDADKNNGNNVYNDQTDHDNLSLTQNELNSNITKEEESLKNQSDENKKVINANLHENIRAKVFKGINELYAKMIEGNYASWHGEFCNVNFSNDEEVSLLDVIRRKPDYNFLIEIYLKDLSYKIFLLKSELERLHKESKNIDDESKLIDVMDVSEKNYDVQKCLRNIFSDMKISVNNCNALNNIQDDSTLNKDTDFDFKKAFSDYESKREFLKNELKYTIHMLESWHEEILVTNIGSRKNKKDVCDINNFMSEHKNENEKENHDTSSVCLKSNEEENVHIVIHEVSVKLLKNMLLSSQNYITLFSKGVNKVQHALSTSEISQQKENQKEMNAILSNNQALKINLAEKEELCNDLRSKLIEYERKKEEDEKRVEVFKTEKLEEIAKLVKAITQKDEEMAKLAELQIDLEGKLNQMCAEKEQMKRQLEEKNNSVECNNVQNYAQPLTLANRNEKSIISSSLSAGDLIWDSKRDEISAELSVDLKKMSELEEELIETKEKCGRLNEDKAELASQLQSMTEKYNKVAQRSSHMDMLMYLVPMAALLLYILIHPYIS